MIVVFVDFNILLDIVINDLVWVGLLVVVLYWVGKSVWLVINLIIYVEFFVVYVWIEMLDDFLFEDLFQCEFLFWVVGFLVGKVYLVYCRCGGEWCLFLLDFYIGVYVVVVGYYLLMCDKGCYQIYFFSLYLIML